jgi:hypothetical protein
MKISKEKILNAFIEYPYQKDVFSQDVVPFEHLLLSKTSIKPTITKDVPKTNFSKAFCLPNEQPQNIRRFNNNNPTTKTTYNSNSNATTTTTTTNTTHTTHTNTNNSKPAPATLPPAQNVNTPPTAGSTSNNNNKFIRGALNTQSQIPKEDSHPIIPVQIELLTLFNKKYNYSLDAPSFYIRPKSAIFSWGPFSTNVLTDMYNTGGLKGEYWIKLIDVFCFSEEKGSSKMIDWIPLKAIENKGWEDTIVDSPYVKYTNLHKEKQRFENKLKAIEEKKAKQQQEQKHQEEEQQQPKAKNLSALFNVNQPQTETKEILDINEPFNANNENQPQPKEDKKEETENNNNNENNVISKQQAPVKQEYNTLNAVLSEEIEGKWEEANKKKKKIRPNQPKGPQLPIGLHTKKREQKLVSLHEMAPVKKEAPVETKIQQPNPSPKIPQQQIETFDIPKDDDEADNDGFVEVNKGGNKKGKKKRRPQDGTNINLGFKY